MTLTMMKRWMGAAVLGVAGLSLPHPAHAFLDTGTLLTNAASATYMGGGQGTSVTYSATAKILVANPAMFLWKDVNPTYVGTLGGTVTYTICFSNGGANSAFNFTITDRWPNNTSWNTAANTPNPPGVYSAWVGGGGGNQPVGTYSGSLAGPWSAILTTPNGTLAPGYFHWVIPMMGVGYSGCITFALNVQ